LPINNWSFVRVRCTQSLVKLITRSIGWIPSSISPYDAHIASSIVSRHAHCALSSFPVSIFQAYIVSTFGERSDFCNSNFKEWLYRESLIILAIIVNSFTSTCFAHGPHWETSVPIPLILPVPLPFNPRSAPDRAFRTNVNWLEIIFSAQFMALLYPCISSFHRGEYERWCKTRSSANAEESCEHSAHCQFKSCKMLQIYSTDCI